jgi:hypothetical protein
MCFAAIDLKEVFPHLVVEDGLAYIAPLGEINERKR